MFAKKRKDVYTCRMDCYIDWREVLFLDYFFFTHSELERRKKRETEGENHS